MTTVAFHTLAELSRENNIKKATLVARVKSRKIPHRKVGNTITISPKHVKALLSTADKRATPLRDERLYRTWSRYKRISKMATEWQKSYDVFVIDVMKLPNAAERKRLRRINSNGACMSFNLEWV